MAGLRVVSAKFCLWLIMAALCGLSIQLSYAQTLPVGTPLLEDYYRREQLLGRLDSSLSFSIRPLTRQMLQREDVFDPDSSLVDSKSVIYTRDGHGALQLMPAQWRNQITSTYPYSINDGAMIPNVGFQTMLSAGVSFRYRFLSIQLNPELVLAQNGNYPGFDGQTRREWNIWYNRIGNFIDQPERFGTGGYSRFLPGQSSFRLNFDPVSIGVSTENLWWGPGLYNSLLMSNTAPGFAHLTLNTTRPVRTPVGSFEAQLVGGRLEASGFPPKELGNPDHFDNFYRPKPEDWRYFSGLILTYQPKWVSGLSLGMGRAFVAYSESLDGKLRNYLPFFDPISKSGYGGPGDSSATADENISRDQLLTLFARWVIPDANAEVYFEYGRNDHAWDMRDLIVQLEHSRAYTLGFRKLTPVNWFNEEDDLLQVLLEVTQGEGPRDDRIRPGGPWYRHGGIRHGYTHSGQLLGAGIGQGSNVQTLNVSWIRGMKQLGVQFERYVHNNDFFYRVSGDMRRNWVDLSTSLRGEWNYKQFIARGMMRFTKAYNYQYELEERPEAQNFWNFRNQDKGNFQLQLDLLYRF